MAVQPLDVTAEAAQSELDSLASIAPSLRTRAPFMISQEEVRLYHERGYAKVEGVLTDAELDALRRVCDAYLELSRGAQTHTDVFDLEPGHTAEQPQLRRIKNPAANHAVFNYMLRHPVIVSVVEQFFGVGRGVRTNGDKLNMKSPGVGSPVQWHQDWAFYPHTNDDILAVGLAIDDTTIENGATQFVPGSHKGPILNHHVSDEMGGFFCGGVTDPDFTAAGAVSVPVKAGGISLHAGRMLHGSPHNLSSTPRRIMFMQYTALDSFPLLGVGNVERFFSSTPAALGGKNDSDGGTSSGVETSAGDVILGEPGVVPLIRECPVRMPFPPAPVSRSGSIYQSQTLVSKMRYMEGCTLSRVVLSSGLLSLYNPGSRCLTLSLVCARRMLVRSSCPPGPQIAKPLFAWNHDKEYRLASLSKLLPRLVHYPFHSLTKGSFIDQYAVLILLTILKCDATLLNIDSPVQGYLVAHNSLCVSATADMLTLFWYHLDLN